MIPVIHSCDALAWLEPEVAWLYRHMAISISPSTDRYFRIFHRLSSMLYTSHHLLSKTMAAKARLTCEHMRAKADNTSLKIEKRADHHGQRHCGMSDGPDRLTVS